MFLKRLTSGMYINLFFPSAPVLLAILIILFGLSLLIASANVFIDGSLIGKTPIAKKFPVKPGWHRVRVVDPNAPPPKFAMSIPDYQDIYVPQGRTQKIRINLAVAEQESAD